MKEFKPKLLSFKTSYSFKVKSRKTALKILDTVEGTMYDNAELFLSKKTGPLYHRINYKFNSPIQTDKDYSKIPRYTAYFRNKLLNRLKDWKGEIRDLSEKVEISHIPTKIKLK